MSQVSEYKLTDLLSSAGATIGIIIGGTIFLQFLSTKFTDLSGRYRDLAVEYRGRREDEPRHAPLQGEIRSYRRRLGLMNWASGLAALALMSFLFSILAGGFSILYPPLRIFKYLGTAGLFAGLCLMVAAVTLGLFEIVLARQELDAVTADLDEHVRCT